MKTRTLAVAAVVLGGWAAVGRPAAAQEGAFVDHGVMARVSESRGVLGALGGDGRDVVVALPMDRYAGALRASLLVVDPETGKSQQYWYPKKEASNDAPFHVLRAGTGRLYTTFGPTFLEFDLATREWTFAGKVGGAAMSLAEGPDGTIYAGTYPACELFAFDPAGRALKKIAKLDAKEEYPSSLVAGRDGWVYVGVGTARCNIVACRPATGEVRPLVAEAERVTGSGAVAAGVDGAVYGRATPTGAWRKLENGAAAPVAEAPKLAAGVGGMKWMEVRGALPGGGRIAEFDLVGRRMKVIGKDGAPRDVRFDYESSGAAVAALAVGPDGKVYGNTSHPMQMFRIDPAGGEGAVTNFGGIARVGGGNFPALAAARGKVVGMAYSGGDVYEFDPQRPWVDGDGEGANPRKMANFRPHIGRPRGALARSDGRSVIFGGFPGYGYAGGGLFIYDVEAGKGDGLAAEPLWPGQSPITMDELPGGDLVVGTSINTPGGGHSAAKRAEVFRLDWGTRKVTWHVPVEGAREVVSVCVGKEGRVYAVTRESELLVTDPAAGKVVHREDVKKLGAPANAGHRTLLRTEGGRVLLVLSKAIAEVDGLGVNVLGKPPVEISAVGAAAGGRVYFGSDASVWSFRVP